MLLTLIIVSLFGLSLCQTPAPTPRTDKLLAGQTLQKGQSLWSRDGMFEVRMQTDGNFVMYRFGNPPALWASHTQSLNAFVVVQPEDGNLVIYDTNGKAVKGLVGKAIDPSVLPTHLHLQDDGNLVLYDAMRGVHFETGVQTRVPTPAPTPAPPTPPTPATSSSASTLSGSTTLSSSTSTSNTPNPTPNPTPRQPSPTPRQPSPTPPQFFPTPPPTPRFTQPTPNNVNPTPTAGPRINCQWSQWHRWSVCSAPGCGQKGEQTRIRTVIMQQQNGGTPCSPDDSVAERACESATCAPPPPTPFATFAQPTFPPTPFSNPVVTNNESQDGLDGGSVAAIIFGVLFFAACVLGIVYFFFVRPGNAKLNDNDSSARHESGRISGHTSRLSQPNPVYGIQPSVNPQQSYALGPSPTFNNSRNADVRHYSPQEPVINPSYGVTQNTYSTMDAAPLHQCPYCANAYPTQDDVRIHVNKRHS